MKTYSDFTNSLNESSDDTKKFIELNKGREGKTLLGVDGKEIAGKIYLGDGGYAYKSSNMIKFVTMTGMYGKEETHSIDSKLFAVLKKAF